MSAEDLSTIAGGCGGGKSPIPKNPKCRECGSTNTWTEYQPLQSYTVHFLAYRI